MGRAAGWGKGWTGDAALPGAEVLDGAGGRRQRGGMNEPNRITTEPDKRGGQPCIRGMRITVADVLGYLASGMTEAEILADFPYLEPEDIRACLAFAAPSDGPRP